jgi:hypothetical protein
MSTGVMLPVLFAALLHASWHAVVKSSPDKFLDIVLVTGSAAALSAIALPFLPLLRGYPYSLFPVDRSGVSQRRHESCLSVDARRTAAARGAGERPAARRTTHSGGMERHTADMRRHTWTPAGDSRGRQHSSHHSSRTPERHGCRRIYADRRNRCAIVRASCFIHDVDVPADLLRRRFWRGQS